MFSDRTGGWHRGNLNVLNLFSIELARFGRLNQLSHQGAPQMKDEKRHRGEG